MPARLRRGSARLVGRDPERAFLADKHSSQVAGSSIQIFVDARLASPGLGHDSRWKRHTDDHAGGECVGRRGRRGGPRAVCRRARGQRLLAHDRLSNEPDEARGELREHVSAHRARDGRYPDTHLRKLLGGAGRAGQTSSTSNTVSMWAGTNNLNYSTAWLVPAAFLGEFNRGSSKLYFGNFTTPQAVAGGTDIGSDFLTALTLGNYGAQGAAWDGTIAEFIIYNRLLKIPSRLKRADLREVSSSRSDV